MEIEVLKVVCSVMDNNTYIVYRENERTALILDPSFCTDKYERAMETYGLEGAAILLTHGHFDHIASVDRLRNKYHCPVYIHKNDADMLTDPEKNQSGSMMREPVATAPADHIIDGEEMLAVGGMTVKVVETPGHTPGGVCYIIDGRLFTGDTLFAGSIGRTDFPGGSMIDMITSLKKLKELPEDYTVYPGHMETSSLKHEKINNYYMHYDLSEN